MISLRRPKVANKIVEIEKNEMLFFAFLRFFWINEVYTPSTRL